MSAGLGAAGANTALTALGSGYTWVQKHTGDPGADGTANVAADSTRKQVTWAAPSSGSMSNGTAASWTAAPSAEDWTYFSAWSSSTAGNFGFSGTVTADAAAAGSDSSAGVGALVVSLTLAA